MSRVSFAVGLMLFAGFGCSKPSTVEAQQPRGRGRDGRDAAALENGWQFEYESAKAEAKKSGKPMMIVFRCVP